MAGHSGDIMKPWTLARLVAVGALLSAMGAVYAQQGPAQPLVTQAEYERWQKELSNWGRWGKDDELGTLNLITPAKRKQAAALVKEGSTVSLAANANPQKGIDNPCPVEWSMVTATSSLAMDRIGYPCIHGAGTTHLDSFEQLAHRQAVPVRQETGIREGRDLIVALEHVAMTSCAVPAVFHLPGLGLFCGIDSVPYRPCTVLGMEGHPAYAKGEKA